MLEESLLINRPDAPKQFSQVRHNLMTRAGYSPYCGNWDGCPPLPRTSWTGEQFKCGSCGWVSQFPADFIAEYKAKWHAEAK